MNRKMALSNMAVARKLRDLSDYDMDDALELVGLRRRPTPTARFLGAMGLVMGGMAVGAVLGMMLAPKAGKDFRQNLPGGMGMGAGSAAGSGASGSNTQGGYGTQPVSVGSQGSNFS